MINKRVVYGALGAWLILGTLAGQTVGRAQTQGTENFFGAVKSVETTNGTGTAAVTGKGEYKDSPTRTVVITEKTNLLEGDRAIDLTDLKKNALIYIIGTKAAAGDLMAEKVFLERRPGAEKSVWNFVGTVRKNENGTITTYGKTLGTRTVITTGDTQVVDSDGTTIKAGDISKGALIRVVGTWEKSPEKITAQKITIVRK